MGLNSGKSNLQTFLHVLCDCTNIDREMVKYKLKIVLKLLIEGINWESSIWRSTHYNLFPKTKWCLLLSFVTNYQHDNMPLFRTLWQGDIWLVNSTYYHKDNQNGKRMKFQKNYKLLSLFNKEVTFLVKEVTKNYDLWLRVGFTWCIPWDGVWGVALMRDLM